MTARVTPRLLSHAVQRPARSRGWAGRADERTRLSHTQVLGSTADYHAKRAPVRVAEVGTETGRLSQCYTLKHGAPVRKPVF